MRHKKLSEFVAVFGLGLAVFGSTVSAHVTVSPGQVKTAERATFAVSVPNEHDSPVVGVRLVIPEGVESVRPFAKPGWDITLTKTGEGQAEKVSEITWSSTVGSVPVDMKDEFQFGAVTLGDDTELKWKAYETYQNGLVVGWDQEPAGDGHGDNANKPYSVTKVVAETEAEQKATSLETEVESAKDSASMALYAGIAGVVLGLISLALVLRKK